MYPILKVISSSPTTRSSLGCYCISDVGLSLIPLFELRHDQATKGFFISMCSSVKRRRERKRDKWDKSFVSGKNYIIYYRVPFGFVCICNAVFLLASKHQIAELTTPNEYPNPAPKLRRSKFSTYEKYYTAKKLYTMIMMTTSEVHKCSC